MTALNATVVDASRAFITEYDHSNLTLYGGINPSSSIMLFWNQIIMRLIIIQHFVSKMLLNKKALLI